MTLRFFLAFAAAASSAMPAGAHAFLQHANPGAGATFQVAHAPQRVVLTFSERLDPGLSGATITDSSGGNMAAAPVTIAGKSMLAPLRPLGPGAYRVLWHAVSLDKHRTEGSYSFKVLP